MTPEIVHLKGKKLVNKMCGKKSDIAAGVVELFRITFEIKLNLNGGITPGTRVGPGSMTERWPKIAEKTAENHLP